MNNREFPKLFSQSCLLGSYLRVIEPGTISKNDSVELVNRDNEEISVYDTAQLLFTDIKNVEKMKKAVDVKHLSEEIKEKFRERLMKLGDFSSL